MNKIRKFLIDRVLGTWHGLYFLHGWGRIGVLPQLAIMFSGWIVSIALLMGYKPRSWLGWGWLAFLTIFIGSLFYFGIVLFGKWDLGKSGSRKTTLLRDFERSSTNLMIFDSLFDAIRMLFEVSGKAHLLLGSEKPKWLLTARWIKEKRRELNI